MSGLGAVTKLWQSEPEAKIIGGQTLLPWNTKLAVSKFCFFWTNQLSKWCWKLDVITMKLSTKSFGDSVQLHKTPALHSWRLTWNLQITNLERKMTFQTSMIMFHVNLQGCIWEFSLKIHGEQPGFPSDLCFLEPDNLKLVKSSHRTCLFNLENKHHFHLFGFKPCNFPQDISSPKSFRFQHSKHFFLKKRTFSAVAPRLFNRQPVYRDRWRPDSGKKGGRSALRAGSIPDFAPQKTGESLPHSSRTCQCENHGRCEQKLYHFTLCLGGLRGKQFELQITR